MPDFIEINNASFAYPSTEYPALSNIQLRIDTGEFIALIGANGSGKSTLAKLLNGLLLPSSGQVLIAGMDTRERNNLSRIRTQVGLVFQRPQDQVVATTVEEDVAFGPCNLGLPPAEIHARLDEALERTGMSAYRARPSYLLSAGETQRLALAGVLAMHPRCVIFDETTAMLDPAGRDMVLSQIRDLNREGITAILITHLMQEAVEAQRVIVLHQGQIVFDDAPEHVFSRGNRLESYGLDLPLASQAGRMLREFFPAIPENLLKISDLLAALPIFSSPKIHSGLNCHSFSPQNTDWCVQIRDLSFSYLEGSPLSHQALDHLNMKVTRGSMHGLIGGTGSGKSTILQHINGLIRPQSGSVQVGKFDLSDKDLDIQALRRKTALAFQQPEDQIFEQYVGDEVAYAPRHLGYEGRLAEIVENSMQAVGLDFAAYKDRLTSTLSGGEKRKVALASVLSVQPDTLLLDEPLSGLDPVSGKEFIQSLKRIHQQGATLIISTHQYEDLSGMLDAVSAIDKGKDIMQGSAEKIFSRVEELEKIGLKAPLGALISQRLTANGWPLGKATASLQALETQLSALRKEGTL